MQVDSQGTHQPRFTLLNRFRRLYQHGDLIWWILIVGMSILTITLIVAIGILLWQNSSAARALFGFAFISPFGEGSWDAVNNNFNSWKFIYGTIITSLVAVVIAVPLSLGVSIFLSELSPTRLRSPISLMVELLAAIPSVVFGFWGIYVFLPNVVAPVGVFLEKTLGQIPLLDIFFAGPMSPSGVSRLAAGLILAIMIVPTITAVSRDVFMAIPRAQREASLALGATQWETISKVLIPYGLSGLLGAIILGLGRAIGETMAVTMVIGNSIEGSYSLLRPGYTMSSVIANEFAEAVSPLHSQVLIEVALILFFITLLVNMIARALVWRVGRQIKIEGR